MPTPVTRVQDIAARLAAAGFQPRVTRFADHIRIEIHIEHGPSTPFAPAHWQAVLAALGQADRYGHDATADGHTVWAAINESPRDGCDRAGGNTTSYWELM